MKKIYQSSNIFDIVVKGVIKIGTFLTILIIQFLLSTTADFFCHSRENGNPGCLWASKPPLDTRFRGHDGWGDSTFCWYSAVLFQRVAVVLGKYRQKST
jgi:hypothetical protein